MRTVFQGTLIVLASAILVYLIYDYYKRETSNNEGFEDYEELNQDETEDQVNEVKPTVSKINNEQPKPVKMNKDNKYPRDCFPKDKLTPDDLLPKDAANSLWSQVNPAGQGDVQNINFLTAGYHFGINSVGSTLRNANTGLRSEPANPQVKVSPWNQTTIEPDLNRRPLEIAGCDA